MYQNISSWVLFILWIIPLIHCDIIKVENETHVYCIDDENKDSTIVISPPLKKLKLTENTIKVFIWENNEWKLMNGSDLLMAPSIKDKIWKVAYLKEESHENYTCHRLDNNQQKSHTIQDKCPAGRLGKNCHMSCSDLLGSNFPNCENFRICLTHSECYCAWGYKGFSCTERCEDGNWGLSCKENCKSCRVCDKSTGECTNFDIERFILLSAHIFIKCPRDSSISFLKNSKKLQ